MGRKCGLQSSVTLGFEFRKEIGKSRTVFNELIRRADLFDLLVATGVSLSAFETFVCPFSVEPSNARKPAIVELHAPIGPIVVGQSSIMTSSK